MKFRVDTFILEDEKVLQEVKIIPSAEEPGLPETISRQVMDIREQHTRDALVKLGWTPPGENKEDPCKS